MYNCWLGEVVVRKESDFEVNHDLERTYLQTFGFLFKIYMGFLNNLL